MVHITMVPREYAGRGRLVGSQYGAVTCIEGTWTACRKGDLEDLGEGLGGTSSRCKEVRDQ